MTSESMFINPKFKFHKIPWPIGIWENFWASYAATIESFIRTNNLQETRFTMSSAVAKPGPDPWRIYGGIMHPHLHFNDKIYRLDDKQWAKFSAGIIADCQAKLARVKTVGFEEGVMMGGVAQML